MLKFYWVLLLNLVGENADFDGESLSSEFGSTYSFPVMLRLSKIGPAP